ncbi:MAG: hypothetical protein ACWA5W_07275 [Phycisphaerales bacterium]
MTVALLADKVVGVFDAAAVLAMPAARARLNALFAFMEKLLFLIKNCKNHNSTLMPKRHQETNETRPLGY